MIKSPDEIRAFRCPVCGKIIEIKSESKEYVCVNVNLTWGENIIFIGTHISHGEKIPKPCRICVNCLANILLGGSPKNPAVLKVSEEIQKVYGSEDKNPKFIGMPRGPWDNIDRS